MCRRVLTLKVLLCVCVVFMVAVAVAIVMVMVMVTAVVGTTAVEMAVEAACKPKVGAAEEGAAGEGV